MEQIKPKRIMGFAAMSAEKRKEVSSRGGKASSTNFKNDPARASEIAKLPRSKRKKP